jgi:hypothetical protein
MTEKGEKKKFSKKQEKERGEALMRIVVGIVSGVIIYVWAYLIALFFIINLIYTIIKGNRMRELAEMSEIWNTQAYTFYRYMTFTTNTRPFPFESLEKSMNRFE